MEIKSDEIHIIKCNKCLRHYEKQVGECPTCYMFNDKIRRHREGRACDNQFCHKTLRGNSDALCHSADVNALGESLERNTEICKDCVYNTTTVGDVCHEN